MSVRIIQADAFTSRPFAGNPAAVCVLSRPADESWMQHVAAEMNLSETAFVVPIAPGPIYHLRWFTPLVEVDLCGHATLATAHVLWEEKHLPHDQPARFETRSGRLTATRHLDWIELDFPADPLQTRIDEPDQITELSSILDSEIVSAARNRFDLLVELADEATVRNLRPDIRRLAMIPARGVIVTSRSASPEFDFVSRFFAPRVGVDEDPVCGSAHCFLAPYWASKLGRSALSGHQVSPRGGIVKVRADGDRVALRGQAVTVLRGEIHGPEFD